MNDKIIIIIKTCVIKTGRKGFLVSNVSLQKDLPTSIAGFDT